MLYESEYNSVYSTTLNHRRRENIYIFENHIFARKVNNFLVVSNLIDFPVKSNSLHNTCSAVYQN